MPRSHARTHHAPHRLTVDYRRLTVDLPRTHARYAFRFEMRAYARSSGRRTPKMPYSPSISGLRRAESTPAALMSWCTSICGKSSPYSAWLPLTQCLPLTLSTVPPPHQSRALLRSPCGNVLSLARFQHDSATTVLHHAHAQLPHPRAAPLYNRAAHPRAARLSTRSGYATRRTWQPHAASSTQIGRACPTEVRGFTLASPGGLHVALLCAEIWLVGLSLIALCTMPRHAQITIS